LIDKERIITRLEMLREYLSILKECSNEQIERLKDFDQFAKYISQYLKLN